VAVAAGRDGGALLAWAAQEGQTKNLYFARPGEGEVKIVRINPEGMTVDSLHQPPGLAVGPGGEIYVSWSSRKPKPPGTFFASDLRLSRSLDGGRTFDGHLRVNDDRPISHSFEGLAVAADGTVFLSWIDSRDGWDKAGTYLARLVERGTRVDKVLKLDGDTCVCCQVSIATGPKDTVAATWRRMFPGDIRDMVLALSRDGGRTFADPVLIHADRWKIAACPHRGGSVAIDQEGRSYVSWYTEGTEERPELFFAVSPDGRRFTPPQRLQTATTSIPDHVRLAVDPAGRAGIVWEDSTAVRRRVLFRFTTDGGRTLSPIHDLSQAIKAYAPDIAPSPTGGFLAAWHEEKFPVTKTVIQSIQFGDTR
jgi:hypothetical protein